MLTTTGLRADLYRLLDRVLATGDPLIVERDHRLLEIRAVAPTAAPGLSRMQRLTPHPGVIAGADDDLPTVWDESAWRAGHDQLA